MFYILILASIIFFIAHLALLITAFPKSELAPTRYFYSHLTLWITGALIFTLTFLYSGSGRSSFLDYFDSTTKKAMIIVLTFALSFIAHCIVKLIVLPLLSKNR